MNLRRKEFLWTALGLMIAGGLFMYFAFDLAREKPPVESYRISMVVRGKNRSVWDVVQQGAMQAADEYNVELSFITLTEENNVFQQQGLLQRELESGAQALVVSAADTEILGAWLNDSQLQIPVITIESPANTQKVAADIRQADFEAGKDLAGEILRMDKGNQRAAVIDWGMESEAVRERKEGLLSVLEQQQDSQVVMWQVSHIEDIAIKTLQERLTNGQTDLLIACDGYGLELGVKALQGMPDTKVSLFGVGASPSAAMYLEQGIAQAIVVQNDFALGYLGVQTAFRQLSEKTAPAVPAIRHFTVRRDNMYDKENQRLLFPLIR